MGTVALAHSLAHSLPPPGYNRSRPHCFVLTLSTDAVYFFQAGTEDLVNEWVATCNYWAARLSKEPLSGGVSNMEYGWNRAQQDLVSNGASSGAGAWNESTDNFDTVSVRSVRSRLSKKSWSDGMGSGRGPYSPVAMEKIHINDWKQPMPPSVPSTHDEETQMEALQKRVKLLKADLAAHELLQLPMQALVSNCTYLSFPHTVSSRRLIVSTEVCQLQQSSIQLGSQIKVASGRNIQI